LKKTRRLKSEANTLPVPVGPGDSHERVLAEIVATGIAGNAFTIKTYGGGTFGELSLRECIAALKASTEDAQRRDTKRAESMLVAQATALNAMFGELARRAAINMGEYMDACERYMRLALKAQSQCRATLETLANIQNPPVVFARQANIAHGPQQVNNGAGETGGGMKSSDPPALEAAPGLTEGMLPPAHTNGAGTNARTRARETTPIAAKRTIGGT
jgi:hypothetical protein